MKREEILNSLKSVKTFKIKNVRIIKMATYYSIFLQVIVDEKLTIKEYLNIENKVKKQLKAVNRLIRFIDIEPVDNS